MAKAIAARKETLNLIRAPSMRIVCDSRTPDRAALGRRRSSSEHLDRRNWMRDAKNLRIRAGHHRRRRGMFLADESRATGGRSMFHDIRIAFRSAAKNPALTSVIVVSLALGIGANTTIFTLINAEFLRPLPVHEPGQLVQIFTVMTKSAAYQSVSLANYRDFRDNVSEFS